MTCRICQGLIVPDPVCGWLHTDNNRELRCIAWPERVTG